MLQPQKKISNGHFIAICLKATIEEVQLYFKLTDFVILLNSCGKGDVAYSVVVLLVEMINT